MCFQATINEILTFYHLQRKFLGAAIVLSWKCKRLYFSRRFSGVVSLGFKVGTHCIMLFILTDHW